MSPEVAAQQHLVYSESSSVWCSFGLPVSVPECKIGRFSRKLKLQTDHSQWCLFRALLLSLIFSGHFLFQGSDLFAALTRKKAFVEKLFAFLHVLQCEETISSSLSIFFVVVGLVLLVLPSVFAAAAKGCSRCQGKI